MARVNGAGDNFITYCLLDSNPPMTSCLMAISYKVISGTYVINGNKL